LVTLEASAFRVLRPAFIGALFFAALIFLNELPPTFAFDLH
jgi:lipopolysaccharide export LptBFGC system permease protein LptF